MKVWHGITNVNRGWNEYQNLQSSNEYIFQQANMARENPPFIASLYRSPSSYKGLFLATFVEASCSIGLNPSLQNAGEAMAHFLLEIW